MLTSTAISGNPWEVTNHTFQYQLNNTKTIMQFITNIHSATDDQIAYEMLEQLYRHLSVLDQPSSNLCPEHEKLVRLNKRFICRRLDLIEDRSRLEYIYSK